ncbi:hypothetical protein AKJ37_01300 [candidate division MSBL1 archaeon SCGC-AAA259I09]|uniref:FAD-binding FR-type domain-containing protein n=1 Tax=candidate division MSBL1 archaeon SCGC-AAA259I09 TaxID=1698267 RepID=A0A133UV91_9EURY|nr:hypothetical protein AKJ37_01300 [candidate division MSBL1 archaeon SCGC-AAA259I09]
MEDFYHAEHRAEVLSIRKVIDETPSIRSIYVDSSKISSKSVPGQFLMVWVIGVDEIPMAVSKAGEDGTLGFSVERVGDATSKLHELEKGELIGIRGPYGNGFDLSGENLLIIGGGCGMAPLSFAAEEAVSEGKNVKFILTASTADELLFRSRLEKLDAELVTGTEDGSAGIKGVTPDVVRKINLGDHYDSCLLCGPEEMMTSTADLIDKKGIPIQVSLNRYMKCGVGICGSCSLDPSGLRVCIEGPVFQYEEIKDSEFGDYKRDSTGSKTGIQ